MSLKKTTTRELLSEISEKVIGYLKAGKINPNSFIEKLNTDVNNLKQLLRIHFVLQEEVRNFIKNLPKMLRNIKTSTHKVNQFLRGEVKGRINCRETIRKRCRRNYQDSSIFVCEEKNKNFNIKENLILKKLLSIIYNIINNDLKPAARNYDWLLDWQEDNGLTEQLKKVYLKNIYLKRVKLEEIKITQRMIAETKQSRNRLYRIAAELLSSYRRLITTNQWAKTEENKVKQIFEKTFIQPQHTYVLFELYWLIKLIEKYDNAKFNLIDSQNNLVANWEEKGKEYSIYHNSTGSDRLKLQIELNEIEELDYSGAKQVNYLSQQVKYSKKGRKISQEVFASDQESSYWRGRPDILLEKRNENDKLEKIIIGEVKYTNSIKTAKKGLKELMDYLALLKVKKEDQYSYADEIESMTVEGQLFLDKVEVQKRDSQGIIINTTN